MRNAELQGVYSVVCTPSSCLNRSTSFSVINYSSSITTFFITPALLAAGRARTWRPPMLSVSNLFTDKTKYHA